MTDHEHIVVAYAIDKKVTLKAAILALTREKNREPHPPGTMIEFDLDRGEFRAIILVADYIQADET